MGAKASEKAANPSFHRTCAKGRAGPVNSNVMRKFQLAVLVAALSVTFASAAETPVLGYFQTKPGIGGASKGMCVTNLQHNLFEVQIRAGHCPSEECMNYRPDGISFKAALKNNTFRYSNNTGCRLKVSFDSKGATVAHNDECRNGEHPYLYANDHYEFMQSSINEDLCRP